MRRDSYSDIKDSFNALRNIDKDVVVKVLTESENDTNEGDGVPYSMDDEAMRNIMETAKAQFGADFTGMKNPMLYYPNDGNVVLCGYIPELNNLKFQFKYKDAYGCGCYLWANYLVLTDENMGKLNRVLGVYKNWVKELSTSEDIKPMSLKNK